MKNRTFILLMLLLSTKSFGVFGINIGGQIRIPDYTDPNWGEIAEAPAGPDYGEGYYCIGIPNPPFGINETYRMYDSEPNQNPALTYQDSPRGGKYTHYVDWEDVNATDTDNPYGTVAIPRRRVPTRLPAGSIVEIHDTGGSGYTRDYPNPSQNYVYFSSDANSTWPTFFCGVGDPNFWGQASVHLSGDYLILEGILFTDERLATNTTYTYSQGLDHKDHIVIRNCEITGYDAYNSGMQMIYLSANYSVVYDCNIHHNGYIPFGDSDDVHGVFVAKDNDYMWVIGNEIHHNDGDAIQVDDGPNGIATPGEYPAYVYIGQNNLYADRENAIDLKYCRHVIVSQNNMWGYTMDDRVWGAVITEPQPVHGSDGSVCLPSNEGCELSWFLFNDINNSQNGFRSDNSEQANTDANCFFIGNIVHDINNYGFETYREAELHFAGNYFYNVGSQGFYPEFQSGTVDSNYVLANNVFSKIGSYDIEYDNQAGMADLASRSYTQNNIFNESISFKLASVTYTDTPTMDAAEPNYAGNLEDDPEFTDPNNDDFTLSGTSPVKSMEISSYATDMTDYFFTIYDVNIATYLTNQLGGVAVYAGKD